MSDTTTLDKTNSPIQSLLCKRINSFLRLLASNRKAVTETPTQSQPPLLCSVFVIQSHTLVLLIAQYFTIFISTNNSCF